MVQDAVAAEASQDERILAAYLIGNAARATDVRRPELNLRVLRELILGLRGLRESLFAEATGPATALAIDNTTTNPAAVPEREARARR